MRSLIVCQISLWFLFLGCKFKLAEEPAAMAFESIRESKENNAFVAELKPQQPFIEIEGHKLFITSAWLEHPHNQANFGYKVWSEGYCYVVELDYNPKLDINLRDYIEELGNGSTIIWSFLTKRHEKNDSIIFHYRTSLNHVNKDKIFLLYRK